MLVGEMKNKEGKVRKSIKRYIRDTRILKQYVNCSCIFAELPATTDATSENIRPLLHKEDLDKWTTL
jgi:hypothetical protein